MVSILTRLMPSRICNRVLTSSIVVAEIITYKLQLERPKSRCVVLIMRLVRFTTIV